MGYTQLHCQLCAVAFNIARFRTKYEPPEAGWGYSGRLYYAGDSYDCSLATESGCEDIEIDEPPNELHLPGAGCIHGGGYSGFRIAAEEMKVYLILCVTTRVYFTFPLYRPYARRLT